MRFCISFHRRVMIGDRVEYWVRRYEDSIARVDSRLELARRNSSGAYDSSRLISFSSVSAPIALISVKKSKIGVQKSNFGHAHLYAFTSSTHTCCEMISLAGLPSFTLKLIVGIAAAGILLRDRSSINPRWKRRGGGYWAYDCGGLNTARRDWYNDGLRRWNVWVGHGNEEAYSGRKSSSDGPERAVLMPYTDSRDLRHLQLRRL